MSDFIQLLPDNIANQIAAGEVIQRPASVVKELMENAIDAGATHIDVNIKDSGKTLIQVVDNGQGMSEKDALLCFERHATSKVRNADDLFALTTKGFRGEALASIAAIAHVELKTRMCSSEVGRRIKMEGSKCTVSEEVICSEGTSFEVKNLFYNVPARRNFLKTDSTEFRHIQDEFERVAFAHPDIQMTLTHNGSEVYHLPQAVLRKRIVNLLGNGWNDRLVPIDESTDIVQLKGFIVKPEHARKSRGDQFFFVNNRFFKSSYFNNAIQRAFQGLVKEGAYPGYFLFLDVDPQKIDVNVHPTKTEIKFEEEKFIYAIIHSSVKLALGKYNIAPTLEFDQETSFEIPHAMRSQPAVEPTIQVNTSYNPFRSANSNTSGTKQSNFSQAITQHGFGSSAGHPKDWEQFYADPKEMEEESIAEIDFSVDDLPHSFIVKDSYLISPSKSGLLAIHLRRAIERIVYDSILKSFISKPIESQKLLFPIEKELSKNEITHWENNRTLLKQLGYEASIEENTILSVRAVPSVLQEEVISSSIDRILEKISYTEIEKEDIAHEIIGAIAASAALKKIPIGNSEIMKGLIEQLFQCENHSYTPRNKKIIETITLTEIQQKFN